MRGITGIPLTHSSPTLHIYSILLFFTFTLHEKEGLGQVNETGGCGVSLGLDLRTARTEVTNTRTVIQYLQQNTEEMDLFSSPDARQREGT